MGREFGKVEFASLPRRLVLQDCFAVFIVLPLHAQTGGASELEVCGRAVFEPEAAAQVPAALLDALPCLLVAAVLALQLPKEGFVGTVQLNSLITEAVFLHCLSFLFPFSRSVC